MDSEFSESFQCRFPNIKSIKEILSLEFPPQEWLVDDLLPLGITILAGPPKIGKSYFILDLIKEILKKNHEVFYYAGEDDFRRIQTRAIQLGITDKRLLVHAGRVSPLTTKDTTAIEQIGNMLDFRPTIKAVFIDTMQLILPRITKPRDYESWVHDLRPWAELSNSKNVTILMVHHTRKENNQADYNPYQLILGSQGIIASFDTVMIMSKSKDGKGATLNITGKDVPETEYRLEKKDYGWKIAGLEVEASLGETQDRVHNFIKLRFGCSREDIKKNIDIDKSYLSKILKKLIEKDIIQERDDRYYSVIKKK